MSTLSEIPVLKRSKLVIAMLVTNVLLWLFFLVMWQWPSWNYFSYIRFIYGPPAWKIARYIPALIWPVVNILFFTGWIILKRRGKKYRNSQRLMVRILLFISLISWAVYLLVIIVNFFRYMFFFHKIGG